VATYLIDPSHGEIAFSVKHLMITHIRGFFAQFEGTLHSKQILQMPLFGW
jgi:polyisoprenoid-binding protein YceI